MAFIAAPYTCTCTHVCRYEWRHDISHWIDGFLLGNYHASELSFVWANEWPPILHAFNPADVQMSGFITERWAALAANLSSPDPAVPPSGGLNASLRWPLWTEAAEEHLWLQVPVQNGSFLRTGVCEAVWDRLPK